MDNSVMRKTFACLALTVLSALAPNNAAAAGEPANGETLFARCSICHNTAMGAGNRIGPNLFGIGGRKSGAMTGFAYSSALKNSTIVWTEEELAAFLLDPQGKIPGNRMVFAGTADRTEAGDIAAYLMTLK